MSTPAAPPPATTRDAIAALSRAFRAAGLPSAELDARLLVLDACGLSHEAFLLEPGRPLNATEAAIIAARRDRRLAREPVSRIVGYREFWGRRFALGPATLDPRPDTETLIEAALTLARAEAGDPRPLNIIDLGTGTGCILLTLLAEMPHAFGIGIDRDTSALQIARENAASLGLQARAAFVASDWLDAIGGTYDVIVTNPPYITRRDITALEPEVRCHDPQLALDGGEDGFDAYRRIISACARVAAPGAWVLLEVGAGQATGIITLFTEAGWTYAARDAKVYRDLGGIERVVAIMRQSTRDEVPCGKKRVGNSARSR